MLPKKFGPENIVLIVVKMRMFYLNNLSLDHMRKYLPLFLTIPYFRNFRMVFWIFFFTGMSD